MSSGKINVTADNIFPIIKKFLYSDHEIFLRELISNAVDATQKLTTLTRIGESDAELGDLTVKVKVDKEAKTITVSDRGVGMTSTSPNWLLAALRSLCRSIKTKPMAPPSSDILALVFTLLLWWPKRWRSFRRATKKHQSRALGMRG